MALAPWSSGEVTALTGACKGRASYNDEFRPNGMRFEECKAENQRRDGDDVFERRGFVWWDVKG